MIRRTHVPAANGFLCGVSDGIRCIEWQTPTCQRCAELRPGARRLYVAMARHLLATRKTVSAGEVAYHVHGHATHRLEHLALEADRALFDADFIRASFIGGRFGDVTLWRAPESHPERKAV
jgi:hypothetical protein